ncbi:unnamed protein product [Diatraea saccharalis]|uniref:Kazal-like domain-containing protein n=1 Tax=Diatraea saccharalis TaxID=40085 RepID=A0A9N9WDU6_9NEOP|nr:unnamed protein product [Diatraea saccharalis]
MFITVITTVVISESAWENFRGQQGFDQNRVFIFYPSNNRFPRQDSTDYFNYDDSSDFSEGWGFINRGQMRAQQRQQFFPQIPTSQTVINTATCIRNCPTTSEYNPVCGTNGVTYTNPSRLECAKFCGVDVQLSRNSRCPIDGLPTSSPTNALTPSPPPIIPTPSPLPITPTPSPVTITPSPITLTPFPITPSPSPLTPTPTPTTPEKDNDFPVTPNNLDFTISQDILDDIFTTNYGHLIDERHED